MVNRYRFLTTRFFYEDGVLQSSYWSSTSSAYMPLIWKNRQKDNEARRRGKEDTREERTNKGKIEDKEGEDQRKEKTKGRRRQKEGEGKRKEKAKGRRRQKEGERRKRNRR